MIGVEAALNSFSSSAIDQIMKAIWAASMWLLRNAFELMDSVGGFRGGSALVDASGRPSPAAPFFALWPTLMWIGGSAAVGLFLWQLTLTMVRGGAGFWRVASGPAAYGVATALTLGVAAALVGASEGLTVLLLQRGLAAENFRSILDHPHLGFSDNPTLDSSLDTTARALLMGMIALFGLLPAAIGFLLQTIFRQAIIVVLIATVPITAAGLLANSTAVWFWRSLRWMLAAILLKPALALVLVVGVNMLSGPGGIGGLLAGTGVLLISLWCPLVLFRLLAFVEQGGRLANAHRSMALPPAGPSSTTVSDSYSEQINTARFDAAVTTVPSRSHARSASHSPAAASVARGRAAPVIDRAVGHGRSVPAASPATTSLLPGSGRRAPAAGQLPVGHRSQDPRAAVGSHPGGATRTERGGVAASDRPARALGCTAVGRSEMGPSTGDAVKPDEAARRGPAVAARHAGRGRPGGPATVNGRLR